MTDPVADVSARDTAIAYVLHQVIGTAERHGPRSLIETLEAIAAAATQVFQQQPRYAKSAIKPGTVARLSGISFDDANTLPTFGWNGSHYTTNARDARDWRIRNAVSREEGALRDQGRVVESVRANGTKEELAASLRLIAASEQRRDPVAHDLKREARARLSPAGRKQTLGRISADFDAIRRDLGLLDAGQAA